MYHCIKKKSLNIQITRFSQMSKEVDLQRPYLEHPIKHQKYKHWCFVRLVIFFFKKTDFSRSEIDMNFISLDSSSEP